MNRSCILALLYSYVAYATFIPRAQSLYDCVHNVFGADDASQRIVSPTDPTWTDARIGESIQFDENPQLIAYAKQSSEVAPLVKCAQQNSVQAVPRNGGHHFLAYSVLNNSLVIDTTHIDYVNVASDANSAQVGAGIRLGALYMALDAHNTTFPGGICPTVGLTGLISSGGFNLQQRTLGISADHVNQATVVLADGSVVTASDTENSDLFWALRGGGGGTYGIVTDWNIKTQTFPRSAQVYLQWNGTDVRYDVAKAFLAWAPATDPRFMSQVNVYKDYVAIVGELYGGSAEELHDLFQSSGILDIPTPLNATFSGNCDTDNSRAFGYTVFQCVPDDQVNQYVSILNVIQQPYTPYKNYTQYMYQEVPKAPSIMTAPPWPRIIRHSKSFFLQKSNPISDDVLKGVIDKMATLPEESAIWGEWHAWNVTGDPSQNAFAWREEAYAHFEFQIHGSEDPNLEKQYADFYSWLEGYLRPAVGEASYSGYMDADISTNSLSSYYGNNVCKLVGIKQKYDPNNVFNNPDSIPPASPQGISCPGGY